MEQIYLQRDTEVINYAIKPERENPEVEFY